MENGKTKIAIKIVQEWKVYKFFSLFSIQTKIERKTAQRFEIISERAISIAFSKDISLNFSFLELFINIS